MNNRKKDKNEIRYLRGVLNDMNKQIGFYRDGFKCMETSRERKKREEMERIADCSSYRRKSAYKEKLRDIEKEAASNEVNGGSRISGWSRGSSDGYSFFSAERRVPNSPSMKNHSPTHWGGY